jgi:hypothetical protein
VITPARRVAAAAASAVLLAPLVAAAALLARDLHVKPSSRVAVEVIGAGDTLSEGTAWTVRLAPTHRRYSALVLWPEAAPPRAVVGIRVCGEADSCVSTARELGDGAPLILPLPKGVQGGDVRLSVVDAHGGTTALRSWGGRPAIEAITGRSWALPVARAREFCRALTGSDVLLAFSGMHGAVLLAGVAVAVAGIFGGRRKPRLG